jgi:hypothetical protein
MADELPRSDAEFADPDAVALARVLDGLGPPPDADPAARLAHERALADVDAISRALGLIGDTLAAEPADAAPPASADIGSARSTDAGSVELADVGSAGLADARSTGGGGRRASSAEPGEYRDDALVVPLRRPRTRWMLAAAASVVGLIAVGAVAVVQHHDGSGSSSSVAQQPAAPAAAADTSTAGPMHVMNMAPGADSSAAAAPAAPAAPAAAPAAAVAAPAAAAPAAASNSAAAKASTKAAAGSGNTTSLKAAPRSLPAPDFNAAVACARGIVQGQVVGVTALGGGSYRLTLSVAQWIAPSAGPTRISYTVGSPYSADDSSRTKLAAGQRRVFIVPREASAQVLAYADSTGLRNRITQAQQQAAGQSCG